MNLKEQIKIDLNSALKEGKTVEVLVWRQLLAAILNKEKEKKYKDQAAGDIQLTDQEIGEVVLSEAKKRREAALEFEKGNRLDLVSKEKEELQVLEKYLPAQLSEEEIRKMAVETIKKTGAKEMKDMGKVMSELSAKTKGQAEGGLISKIVKELLGT